MLLCARFFFIVLIPPNTPHHLLYWFAYLLSAFPPLPFQSVRLGCCVVHAVCGALATMPSKHNRCSGNVSNTGWMTDSILSFISCLCSVVDSLLLPCLFTPFSALRSAIFSLHPSEPDSLRTISSKVFSNHKISLIAGIPLFGLLLLIPVLSVGTFCLCSELAFKLKKDHGIFLFVSHITVEYAQ